VDPISAANVATIGASATVHADFGSGEWEGGPIGIPPTTVSGSQPLVEVTFDYAGESDPGPYPIPADAPIEGGPDSEGDRHVLVLDRDACVLYEMFDSWPAGGGSWQAGSGAVFDLESNALRPATWTSADAAGLPILPGLVRYDEVAAGRIDHALRFTAPETRRAYVWPARHFASYLTGPEYPPMGQRFRLKADFDISGFAPEVQVILTALKEYGMMLADNGSAWYISGAPDERWDNGILHQLHSVPTRARRCSPRSGSSFRWCCVDPKPKEPSCGKPFRLGSRFGCGVYGLRPHSDRDALDGLDGRRRFRTGGVAACSSCCAKRAAQHHPFHRRRHGGGASHGCAVGPGGSRRRSGNG
jgi:hypothetical protein